MSQYNACDDELRNRIVLRAALGRLTAAARHLRQCRVAGFPFRDMAELADSLGSIEQLPITTEIEIEDGARIEEALQILSSERVIWSRHTCELFALIDRLNRHLEPGLPRREFLTTSRQVIFETLLLRCAAGRVGSPEASELLRGVRSAIHARQHVQLIVDVGEARLIEDGAIAPLFFIGDQCRRAGFRAVLVAAGRLHRRLQSRLPDPLLMVDSLVEAFGLFSVREQVLAVSREDPGENRA